MTPHTKAIMTNFSFAQMKIEKMAAVRKNISNKFSSLFQSPEPGIHQIKVPLTNEVSCRTDSLNLPKFLAVELDTDSQGQTQCDEIDQLRHGCRASFVGSFPSQMPFEMQSRYRDDEDGGGPRILDSQPEYSQDAQRVDDELSASFDDSTNVPSKDFISGDT